MDDDLAGGSTAAGSSPAAGPSPVPPAADWNTSLAVPAPVTPEPSTARAIEAGRAPSKSQSAKPVWQDPAELPAVQRALAGAFGEKLTVLADAVRTVQAVMASIDVGHRSRT